MNYPEGIGNYFADQESYARAFDSAYSSVFADAPYNVEEFYQYVECHISAADIAAIGNGATWDLYTDEFLEDWLTARVNGAKGADFQACVAYRPEHAITLSQTLNKAFENYCEIKAEKLAEE